MINHPRKVRVPQVNTKPKHLTQFEDQDDFDGTMELFGRSHVKQFQSIDGYLDWVAGWKQEYQEVSAEIRRLKPCRDYALVKARARATEMLRERAVAKAISWHVKQSKKEELLVAAA